MQDNNHVSIIGRVTKDIDDKNFGYTTGGTACLNISIASNESRKNGDTWEDYGNFFDVRIWGKTAETMRNFLGKGKQVAIEGHLHQDRWDGKDGSKHSRVFIVADKVQLLGGKAGAGNESQPQPEQESSSGDLFPEDIPF